MASTTIESDEGPVRYEPAPSRLYAYPDIIQGTEQWNDARRGMVTASVIKQLITPGTLKVATNETSRALTALLVAERITGHTEETSMTPDMWRGVESEPHARAKYAEHFAPVTEMGFMVREGDGWRLGFSPDGLVDDDGLIEIKAPRAKTHLRTILRDEVPAEYVMQCQAGLFVSGRKWLDFISFSGGMPLYVKRVYPDLRIHEAIVEAVRAFETAATEMADNYYRAVEGMPATERIEQLGGIEF